MTTAKFIDKAKALVSAEVNNEYEPQLVWFGYVLGNIKALLITVSPDQYYYEVTYNKSKEEIYMDKYSKVKHVIVSSNEIN